MGGAEAGAGVVAVANAGNRQRLPFWLVKKIGPQELLRVLRKDFRKRRLTTVCEEARCPNIGECWARRTATFMVLGEVCTRHCGFCSVRAGTPPAVDPAEPEHVAEMVAELGLRHVVITMVARDDLADGGGAHVARVIAAIRARNTGTAIEVLTSDFGGREEPLREVIAARPDLFNHNIETVERLTPQVRHRATYRGSLELLRRVRRIDPQRVTKSGLMLGLGETRDEVRRTLEELCAAGCELLTIGQYLQPTGKNLPVAEYLPPEVFEEWRVVAEGLGFRKVASGPFVRSSYHAEELAAGR